MSQLAECQHIDDFLFSQLVLDEPTLLPDRFHSFKSYPRGKVEKFLAHLNSLLGRTVYYTEEPASTVGIVMNIEKGTLIHLGSLSDFSLNVVFSYLSNRIMISLKTIVTKCIFAFDPRIDLQMLKLQLGDWHVKFKIPFKKDTKGRLNYPLDVKYTTSNFKDVSVNKVLVVRPKMEPEYLKEICYGYKCNLCLKVGCSQREISRHCNTHKPHAIMGRGYCQRVSRGFVLCTVSERFMSLHVGDDITIERGEDNEERYLKDMSLGEKKCSFLMKESNEYPQFRTHFLKEYKRLKVQKPKRTLLKKRRLLWFYLSEDGSREHHFSLNSNERRIQELGDLAGRIVTICKMLHAKGYQALFQNDEEEIIHELIQEPTWGKFVELIIAMVNECTKGLLRTIVIALLRDYDPVMRKVKPKSWARRVHNIKLLVFLFRVCLIWYSQFEDDILNCELLQLSLKNKWELTALMDLYYPMVKREKKLKSPESEAQGNSHFDKEFMSYTHPSDWGFHLVGVYSLHMVLKRNEARIKKIIAHLKEHCGFKENGQDKLYVKLAENGDLDVVDNANREICSLLVEILMILNPGVVSRAQYEKLKLFKVTVIPHGQREFALLQFKGQESPFSISLEGDLFSTWLYTVRQLYYDNESGGETLFSVGKCRKEIITHMTNEQLETYLNHIKRCELSSQEWIRMIRCSWKLSGEGHIKGNVPKREFATVYGDEYDEFNVKRKSVK